MSHDESYYEADGVAIMSVEDFDPFRNIEDVYAVWASLVMRNWVVSACWGPVNSSTVVMVQSDSQNGSHCIESKGANICEALSLAALEVIK